MVPKTKGSDIQLSVIQRQYKPDEKFLKESHLKIWFDKRDLSPYGEYVGSRGEVLKRRIMVYNKSTQTYYQVNHSLKEMETALQATNNIGFKTT